MPLPAPQPSFVKKKAAILAQLSVPASEYTDSSPKGSVDEGIRELIDEINAHEGFVTTSSCAGRVSVFVEGRKAARLPAASGIPGLGPDSDDRPGAAVKQGVSDKPASSAGGKGGGGSWLFVSHEPISVGLGPEGGKDVVRQLGLEFSEDSAQDLGTNNGEPPRLIHFKFEPMVGLDPLLCGIQKQQDSSSKSEILLDTTCPHFLAEPRGGGVKMWLASRIP